jgi:hypothetical protein
MQLGLGKLFMIQRRHHCCHWRPELAAAAAAVWWMTVPVNCRVRLTPRVWAKSLVLTQKRQEYHQQLQHRMEAAMKLQQQVTLQLTPVCMILK